MTFHAPDNFPLARLSQRVKEFEDSLKAEATVLTLHQATLPFENSSSVDALHMMAQMAQPMGITDLSRRFDEYTKRIVPDETTS